MELTATLKTKSGTPLVNRQIIFKKGNTEIDAIYTNNNGVATKTVNITNAGEIVLMLFLMVKQIIIKVLQQILLFKEL